MTGTNNLSKMKSKKFLLILAVLTVLYLLLELFFENAMVYISGGIIGGTISELFKSVPVPEGVNTLLVFLIWAILLFCLVILFHRLRHNPLKYLVLLLVAFFLYIIDNSLAFIQNDIATNYYLTISGVRILSKSLLLSAIVYYGLYGKKRATKAVE